MIIKRNGVFETNSSSAHAITLSKDTIQKTIQDFINEGEGIEYISGEDKIIIDFNQAESDFGWGVETYTLLLNKLAYLLLTIKINEELIKEIDTWKITDKDNGILYLKNIIKSFFGIKYVEFIHLDDYFYNGLIDHQSTEVALGLLQKNTTDDIIIDYLFNPNSKLIISNDNGGFDYDNETNYFTVSYKKSEKYKFNLILKLKDNDYTIGFKNNISDLDANLIGNKLGQSNFIKYYTYKILNGKNLMISIGNPDYLRRNTKDSDTNNIKFEFGNLIYNHNLVFFNINLDYDFYYDQDNNLKLIKENKLIEDEDYILVPFKIIDNTYGEF